MYVYRYIPFDRFKEVVEDKALYFVNPLRWDDEKEAFLFRAEENN